MNSKKRMKSLNSGDPITNIGAFKPEMRHCYFVRYLVKNELVVCTGNKGIEWYIDPDFIFPRHLSDATCRLLLQKVTGVSGGEKPAINTNPINKVFQAVKDERNRQEKLKEAGKFDWTCADKRPNSEKLSVLAEEFGESAIEVCEEMNGKDTRQKLRKELIQVAAVSIAWIEALDRELAI